MAKLIYALYDAQEMTLVQFSADATILAKDAVAAYLTEKVISKTVEEDWAKDFLTAISNSKDVPELLIVLESYDFKLALMPIP